jgi:hypothetical protein
MTYEIVAILIALAAIAGAWGLLKDALARDKR